MDIILELADTFIADHVYAYLYPVRPELYDYPQRDLANASISPFTSWTYKPATKLFQIQPYDAAYKSSLMRDNPYRQFITLYFITWFFGLILYFVFATLSFYLIFDKRTMKHPKYIKNQIWLEVKQTNKSMPGMSIMTAVCFWLEVRGFGKLFDATEEGPGLWYSVVQFPFFLVFTDFFIYWIHRYLHHPRVYKHLHKPHHKWIMPTPFASHAFHPMDGFAQSIPYHIFPFLFPLQKWAYIILFIFVNFWTILIHDGEFLSNNPIVNGAACHSLHHSRFEVNYGQFFTAFDRLGGTYRMPEAWMFEKERKMSDKLWKKEAETVDKFVKVIEGTDDRTYTHEKIDAKKHK